MVTRGSTRIDHTLTTAGLTGRGISYAAGRGDVRMALSWRVRGFLTEKVEVGSFWCLNDAPGVQATPTPIRQSRQLEICSASVQFCFVYEEIDTPAGHVQLDRSPSHTSANGPPKAASGAQ